MKDGEMVRLLLVDDESDFLESIGPALKRRGFDVTTCLDPRAALKILEQERFDVAVLDVKMPGLSGDQLFRQLKLRWPEVQVIMLTGHGSVQQAFGLSQEGVFEYLAKPCEVEKLAATCMNAVAVRVRGKVESEPAGEAPLAGPVRLLLIDDEEEFLESIVPALKRRGMEVESATRGEDALDVLVEKNFDVVLLDFKMPGLDGLETLRRIKKLRPTCQVIIISGLPNVASVVESLREGAFDYLVKPQDMELLVRKIRRAFRAAGRQAEEERQLQVSKILDRNKE